MTAPKTYRKPAQEDPPEESRRSLLLAAVMGISCVVFVVGAAVIANQIFDAIPNHTLVATVLLLLALIYRTPAVLGINMSEDDSRRHLLATGAFVVTGLVLWSAITLSIAGVDGAGRLAVDGVFLLTTVYALSWKKPSADSASD